MKKKILLLLMIFAFSFCVKADITSNLILYVDFEDATIEDDSPNPENITNNGVTTNITDPIIGSYSGDFDGASNFNLADVDKLDLEGQSNVTLSLWFYIDSIPSSIRIMWGKAGGDSGTDQQYGLRLGNPSDDDKALWLVGASSWDFIFSNTSTPINQWVHLAGTSDGSTIKLYMNGTLDSVGSTGGTIAASTMEVYGGSNSLDQRFFTGRLDDMRIYNRSLDASEILALYNLKDPQTSGPVLNFSYMAENTTHYYPLNNNTENFIDNVFATSIGANATDPGFGYINNSFNFSSGSTARITISGDISTNYTKTAWVYATSASGGNNIITSANTGHAFWLNNGNSKLSAGHGEGANLNIVEDPDDFPLNEWVFAGVTYTGNNMTLYKNGEIIDQSAIADFSPLSEFNIGTFDDSFGWDGLIDEARVFNVSLTDVQMEELYNLSIANRNATVDNESITISTTFPLNQTYEVNVTEINYTVTGVGTADECFWGNSTFNSTAESEDGNFAGLNFGLGNHVIQVFCNNTNATLFESDSLSFTVIEPTPPSLLSEIACFGNSITSGFGIGASNTYCQKINDTGDYLTYNWGVSGETTEDLEDRMTDVTGKGYNTTILLIGTNDLRTDSVGTTLEEYYINMLNITQLIIDDGQNVILSNLPPCNSTARNCSDSEQTQVELRNSVINRVSYDKSQGQCEIFDSLFSSVYTGTDFYNNDGLHPTAAKHDEMNSTYISCIENPVAFNCDSNPSECYNFTASTNLTQVGIPATNVVLLNNRSDNGFTCFNFGDGTQTCFNKTMMRGLATCALLYS